VISKNLQIEFQKKFWIIRTFFSHSQNNFGNKIPKSKNKIKSKSVKKDFCLFSRTFLSAGHVALLTASAAVLSVPRSAIKATNANWRKLHQQLIAIAGKNASASQQLPVIKATDMMFCQNWLAKPQIWSKIQIRAVKISYCFWFKLLADNSTNKETDTGPLRGT
jgi:hypothetical protein